MTEADIDRWAAIYAANPHLARAGVEFGALLDDPALLFASLPAPEPEGPRPLLPAQRRIATRILRDQQIADAVTGCRDDMERDLPPGARHRERGGFVQPLSHHAWGHSAECCRVTRPHR